MKAIILAGGTRSTISNEQQGIPKPMVEIGGKKAITVAYHEKLFGIWDQ